MCLVYVYVCGGYGCMGVSCMCYVYVYVNNVCMCAVFDSCFLTHVCVCLILYESVCE